MSRTAAQVPTGGGADPQAEEVATALRYVLRSTQARPQTEAELAQKLRRREHGDDVIDAALAQARSFGAVDDGAFARAWVEDRGLNRGFGAARLHQELRRRGVTDADIDAALAQLEPRDDHTTAVELARRRLAQLPSGLSGEARIRRLGGYLMRRGHPPGLAERAAREVLGELDDPD